MQENNIKNLGLAALLYHEAQNLGAGNIMSRVESLKGILPNKVMKFFGYPTTGRKVTGDGGVAKLRAT